MTSAAHISQLATWIDEEHLRWSTHRADKKTLATLAAEVERYIRRSDTLGPRLYRVVVHGSSANGLGTDESDLDLVVLFRPSSYNTNHQTDPPPAPTEVQCGTTTTASKPPASCDKQATKQGTHGSPRSVAESANDGSHCTGDMLEISPEQRDRNDLISRLAQVLWADMRVRYKISRLVGENIKVPLVKMSSRYPEIPPSACPPIDISVEVVDSCPTRVRPPQTDSEQHSNFLLSVLAKDAHHGSVFEKCAVYIKSWARTNGIWAGFSGLPSHVLVMLLVIHMESEGCSLNSPSFTHTLTAADYVSRFFQRYQEEFPPSDCWYCCPVTGRSMYPGPTGLLRLRQECRNAVTSTGGKLGTYERRLEFTDDDEL